MITHSIPTYWRDTFAELPGYDPVATAGDCWFDAKMAEKAIGFIEENLTHIEGTKAGQPFLLEPFQKAIVGCAFGWKQQDGLRRYREVFQYIPRKNGKTTQLGALVNLVAFCDDEPGAQIYSAAAEKEQAALVYRQTKGMILANPELAKDAKIYVTFKSIEFPGNIVYKALSADADTKHGFNTHFVVVDELHNQPNRDLVDVLVTSTGSRTQPLVWYITTADFKRDSICNEKYDYACKVRDNGGDPSKPGYDQAFLPVIFEASMDDDWTSEDTWRKANPNLGISVSLEYLRRECLRAQETPSYENTFRRLHLNQQTEQDVRWLQMEKWDACPSPIRESDLLRRECWAGLDLSTTTDISAFVLAFPLDDARVALLPWFWVPKEGVRARERKDRVPYQEWVRRGLLRVTEGNVIDYDVIRRDITELGKKYNIQEIACDRWNANQIITQLDGDGFEMVAFGQGYKDMSAPTKELEKLVMAGKLIHFGNPILRHHASCAAVDPDHADNLKPSKKKSTDRIDGIVAATMALGRALVRTGSKSPYHERGLISIGGDDDDD